ncbi:MAG TPA: hypothetical protein VGB75_05880 [Jatrophihabitans sp.]|jgi:NagD protein
MSTRPPIECWLTDMDGVLVHEDKALPGAAEFLQRLVERQRRFLVLTNNSIYTPRDLAARLVRAGLLVPEQPSGPRRWRPRRSWPISCLTARPTSSARRG